GINARGHTLVLSISARGNSNTSSTRACHGTSSCSSSISASDTTTTSSSIVSSLVVARGISELARKSKPETPGTSADSNSEVEFMDVRWSTSFLNLETSLFKVVTSVVTLCPLSRVSTLFVRAPIDVRRGVKVAKIARSIIQGISISSRKPAHLQNMVGVEVDVPNGLEAEIGKASSTGIKLTSTSRDVSTGDALLLSTSSRVYLTFMHRISVEDVGVTPISLFSSRGTLAHRHNSVISTRKGRDVWHCLSLMVISCSIINPNSSLFWAMIDSRQAVFGWRRMD
ncbi:hypothetical protein H5410_021579, partial [Solanum commersonii]